eukprot:7196-Heterococcus_DN1.PRE.4
MNVGNLYNAQTNAAAPCADGDQFWLYILQLLDAASLGAIKSSAQSFNNLIDAHVDRLWPALITTDFPSMRCSCCLNRAEEHRGPVNWPLQGLAGCEKNTREPQAGARSLLGFLPVARCGRIAVL